MSGYPIWLNIDRRLNYTVLPTYVGVWIPKTPKDLKKLVRGIKTIKKNLTMQIVVHQNCHILVVSL